MSPATFLPDDLVLEILARLPPRSLYTCMCVSKSWNGLISDPANRHKFAQTLSGLFFSHPQDTGQPALFFASLSSPPPPPVDPAFSFLPSSYKKINLLDSCNGLFLLLCSLTTPSDSQPLSPSCFYVVCNPTTEELVVLPQPSNEPGQESFSDELLTFTSTKRAALGFDPAVSPHFHVFQLVEEEVPCYYWPAAVEIYSSETGNWVLSNSELDGNSWISIGRMTYFNGFLHFMLSNGQVASVDTTGQIWRVTPILPDRKNEYASCSPGYGFIGHSRGSLHYVNDVDHNVFTIYALEGDKKWVLKQKVSKLDLFGLTNKSRPRCFCIVAAIHPDSDVIIFCDRLEKRLVSYNIDRRKVHIICTLEEVPSVTCSFKPYVPLYSGPLLASPKLN